MRANLILKSFACLAVAGVIAGCGGQKKKEEAAKAEQARLDSLKQEEMIQKQKAAGDLAARLPEEPIFDIVTNLGTIKVKLYSKTPKHRAISKSWRFQDTLTACCSTGSLTDS